MTRSGNWYDFLNSGNWSQDGASTINATLNGANGMTKAAGASNGDPMSMLANMGLGLATGSAGASLLGDAVGGLGLMAGNALVDGLTGGSSSASQTSTDAAVKAADAMMAETAKNKSSLLQNTNSLGSQGAKAGIEAQQAMNSQALSGDAIRSMNEMRNSASKLMQNQMSLANNQMKQNQQQTEGIKDQIRNAMGGSATSKLGNIGSLANQLAKNNAGSYGQTAQAMSQAGAQAGQMMGDVSNIRNQDLASNFERNVKPTLNNWENFQGMASSLGGQAVSSGTSAASNADAASYNLLGGTAGMLGQRAGSQEKYQNFMQQAPWLSLMQSTTGGLQQ